MWRRGRDGLLYLPSCRPPLPRRFAIAALTICSVNPSGYDGKARRYTQFPKPKKMTVYSRMVQINKAIFHDLTWD
jgi:hypothetical protein